MSKAGIDANRNDTINHETVEDGTIVPSLPKKSQEGRVNENSSCEENHDKMEESKLLEHDQRRAKKRTRDTTEVDHHIVLLNVDKVKDKPSQRTSSSVEELSSDGDCYEYDYIYDDEDCDNYSMSSSETHKRAKLSKDMDNVDDAESAGGSRKNYPAGIPTDFTSKEKEKEIDNNCAFEYQLQKQQENESYAFALFLQEQEKKMLARPTNNQCQYMDTAWNLVEWMMDTHSTLSKSCMGSKLIDTIAVDDMVFTTRKFIECHDLFLKKGICANVCLGFHYTHSTNLEKIQQDGLVTWAERGSEGRKTLSFGDGIYTSNNPTNFAHFGDIGIMVAMMKGRCVTVTNSSSSHQRECNTIIGNKGRNASKYGDDPCDEIVLQESCQCLPLIKFNRSLLQDDPTNGTVKLVAYYKEVLQYFDTFFNSESALPTQLDCQSGIPWPTQPSKSANISPSLQPPKQLYQIPSRSTTTISAIDSSTDVMINLCNKRFTYRAPDSFNINKFSSNMMTPKGLSPSGTLEVSMTASLCSSFEHTSTQTFVLTYSIQEGVQKSYHPLPGTHYSGTTRVAYIPDVLDGRSLIKRLIYAFLKGLTFKICITGGESQISWANIHHKTSQHPGNAKESCFPDKTYFMNCNKELDLLGVPLETPIEELYDGLYQTHIMYQYKIK